MLRLLTSFILICWIGCAPLPKTSSPASNAFGLSSNPPIQSCSKILDLGIGVGIKFQKGVTLILPAPYDLYVAIADIGNIYIAAPQKIALTVTSPYGILPVTKQNPDDPMPHIPGTSPCKIQGDSSSAVGPGEVCVARSGEGHRFYSAAWWKNLDGHYFLSAKAFYHPSKVFYSDWQKDSPAVEEKCQKNPSEDPY